MSASRQKRLHLLISPRGRRSAGSLRLRICRTVRAVRVKFDEVLRFFRKMAKKDVTKRLSWRLNLQREFYAGVVHPLFGGQMGAGCSRIAEPDDTPL